jgi:CheY-like chemotaxis protein
MNAKVLVVAEPARTRQEIESAIAHFGAQIMDASTVAEALELIVSERPDLLVVDVAMPGEDGYALIRRVRALPEDHGRNTPAIAITSHPRTLDRLRALSSGYQHHFARPLDPAECAAIIAALLPESR